MCAEGNALTATGACMAFPGLVSVGSLELVTASAALVFNVDPTSHMRGDNVWVFAGSHDTVVNPGEQASRLVGW